MSSTQAANLSETTGTAQPDALLTVPASQATVKTVAPKMVKAPAKKRVPRVKPIVVPPVIEAATQPVVKAAKAPAKALLKAPAKPATVPVAKPGPEKLLKDKKTKLVRDSFTIPKVEYLMLDQLKQRSGTLGSSIKKSELIRAGIKALALMSDASFLAAIQAVPTIKTGRPAND